MGGMCGRGLCFCTSTLLLYFFPSPTTHLANSQGVLFPRALTKTAKAPTYSKEEVAGRNGKFICPKMPPNGEWRHQGSEMSPSIKTSVCFLVGYSAATASCFALSFGLGCACSPSRQHLGSLSMMVPWPWHPPAGFFPGLNSAWSSWEVAVPYLRWRGQTAWRRWG